MKPIQDAHRQTAYSLRLDWGPTGAEAVGPGSDISVVVDVLSFTTTVTVAAERGIEVYPYRWRDGSALGFAQAHDAALAVGRSQAIEGQVSLSPASVRDSTGITRLVLPSPNGSTIAAKLTRPDATVVGVSLRNRMAAADWLTRQRSRTANSSLAVIAAGERWPDGTLRPAVEDLWGAGALIGELVRRGWTGISPEAQAAAAAFESISSHVRDALHECSGGRELAAMDFSDDVGTAAQIDESGAVPILRDGSFRAL